MRAAKVSAARRRFLLIAGATGMAAALGAVAYASDMAAPRPPRRFKFVHIDVFTSQPLLGNPRDVFLDARGMSNAEMLAVTRETFLSEATFVFPRDLSIERELGVSVRIFTPDGEIPFAGHPTLETAAVLRQLRLASRSANSSPAESLAEISLDLKVGKVPVTFRADGLGKAFGEMRQVSPKFGPLHDKGDRRALAQSNQ